MGTKSSLTFLPDKITNNKGHNMNVFVAKLGKPSSIKSLFSMANAIISAKREQLFYNHKFKLVRGPYYRDGNVCMAYSYERVPEQ